MHQIKGSMKLIICNSPDAYKYMYLYVWQLIGPATDHKQSCPDIVQVSAGLIKEPGPSGTQDDITIWCHTMVCPHLTPHMIEVLIN